MRGRSFLLVALMLGMALVPAVSVPTVRGATTINAPTVWTTDQMDVTGFSIQDVLIIDALNSSEGDGNIDVVFGSGGTGDFIIEEEGIVYIKCNDNHRVFIRGLNATSQGNQFDNQGKVIVQDYNAHNTSVFIGTNETLEKCMDNSIRDVGEMGLWNYTFFLTDLSYTYDDYGTFTVMRHCYFGDGTEGYSCRGFGADSWFYNCSFNPSTKTFISNYGSRFPNLINCTSTQAFLTDSTFMDRAIYWSRFYPHVVDTNGNPIENATIILSDSYDYEHWYARTNALGTVNVSTNRHAFDCLITVDYVEYDNGTYTHWNNASMPSTINVFADGYLVNSTNHNFTADWGNATNPIDFELEAIPDPPASVNMTIRTYSENVTLPANRSSRFAYADTVWLNGTVNVSETVNAVYINVTVFNETNASVATVLATTTHNFIANVPVNLTEIAGGVLNWTPTQEGQLYARLNVWKGSEVINSNVTEDFLISNITSATYWVNDTIAGVNVVKFACFFEYDAVPPFSIQFWDRTKAIGNGVEYWSWDFGDGSPLEHAENPLHEFPGPGNYNVSLRVRNSVGDIDTYEAVVQIRESVITMQYYLIGSGFMFVGLIGVAAVYSRNRQKDRKGAAFASLMAFVLVFIVVLTVLAMQWSVG